MKALAVGWLILITPFAVFAAAGYLFGPIGWAAVLIAFFVGALSFAAWMIGDSMLPRK